MVTADTLTAQVTAELAGWDHQYQLDLDLDGCRLTIADDGFDAHIDHISVPDTARRAGLATAMLTAVCEWADREGQALRLHMSVQYGTDQGVLARLYGRHGFVAVNRGGDMLRTANLAAA